MRTTIDGAGRLVIPKQLRDRAGIRPGPVEVFADGTGVRVEGIADESLVNEAGRLVIPGAGVSIDDGAVQALRDAGQR